MNPLPGCALCDQGLRQAGIYGRKSYVVAASHPRDTSLAFITKFRFAARRTTDTI
jgi:hypothetical protein